MGVARVYAMACDDGQVGREAAMRVEHAGWEAAVRVEHAEQNARQGLCRSAHHVECRSALHVDCRSALHVDCRSRASILPSAAPSTADTALLILSDVWGLLAAQTDQTSCPERGPN